MIAREDIVEDMHYAVAVLQEVCDESVSTKDPLLSAIQEAGMIFAFLYCNDVLEILLCTIYADNYTRDFSGDIEDVLEELRKNKVLSEIEYKAFFMQFGLAVLVEIDRSILKGELAHMFKEGLTHIPLYARVMRQFFNKVHTTYDIFETELGDSDGKEH